MKDRRTEGFYLIYRGQLLSMISWSLVLFPYLIFDVLGYISVNTERIGMVARFLFALVNVFQVLISLILINGTAVAAAYYPGFRRTLRLILMRLAVGTIAALVESMIIAAGNTWESVHWLQRSTGELEFSFRIVNMVSYYILSCFITLSILGCFSRVLYDYGTDPQKDRLLQHYRSRVILYSLIPLALLFTVQALAIRTGMNLQVALEILRGHRGSVSAGQLSEAVCLCILWIVLFFSAMVRFLYHFTIIKKCRELAQRIERISS